MSQRGGPIWEKCFGKPVSLPKSDAPKRWQSRPSKKATLTGLFGLDLQAQGSMGPGLAKSDLGGAQEEKQEQQEQRRQEQTGGGDREATVAADDGKEATETREEKEEEDEASDEGEDEEDETEEEEEEEKKKKDGEELADEGVAKGSGQTGHGAEQPAQPAVGECQPMGMHINPPANVCCKCKAEVDPLRCYGKTQPTWKYKTCNIRCVQLIKAVGSWPFPGFKELSEEEKTVFWQQAKACKGGKEVEKLAESKISSKTMSHQGTSTAGSWYPLSVWQAKGFDPKVIEEPSSPQTRRPCPRFGMLYQVHIEMDSYGSLSEKVQESSALIHARPGVKALAPAALVQKSSADGTGEEGKEDEDSSDDDSSSEAASSSDNSSSSSTKHRKGKKGKGSKKDEKGKSNEKDKKGKSSKKDKKEKREKERQRQEERQRQAEQRAKELEDKQAKATTLRDANRALAKLSSVQIALDTSLSNNLIKHVPTFAATKAKHASKAVVAVMKSATAVVQTSSSSFNHT